MARKECATVSRAPRAVARQADSACWMRSRVSAACQTSMSQSPRIPTMLEVRSVPAALSSSPAASSAAASVRLSSGQPRPSHGTFQNVYFTSCRSAIRTSLTTYACLVARLSIQKVHVGEKDVNCYVLGCSDTKEAIVIDPGGNAPKILSQLTALTVRWICFTHAHPGHTGAKEEVKSATSAPTAMHLADATALLKPADRYLTGGDSLPFGSFSLEVLLTPGHTPGGLSFRVGNHLFTGDTLLAGKIGRVDLPG